MDPGSDSGAAGSTAAADLALFTRQLGAMLDAGVSVLRALRISSQHTGSEVLIRAAQEIGSRLEDGAEFHEAIRRRPDLFDPFYVEMARQGETDGLLGQALIAVADFLDRQALGPDQPDSGVGAEGGELPVGPVFRTLGRVALGVAALSGLAATGALSKRWVGPLAAAWSGYCFLLAADARCGGGRIVPRITLPHKSRGRRMEEAEAVVRNAVDEEQEAQEVAAAEAAGVPLPDFLGGSDEEPAFSPA